MRQRAHPRPALLHETSSPGGAGGGTQWQCTTAVCIGLLAGLTCGMMLWANAIISLQPQVKHRAAATSSPASPRAIRVANQPHGQDGRVRRQVESMLAKRTPLPPPPPPPLASSPGMVSGSSHSAKKAEGLALQDDPFDVSHSHWFRRYARVVERFLDQEKQWRERNRGKTRYRWKPKLAIISRGPQGWGNQIRAFMSVFLYAVLTERVLVIAEHPMLTSTFLSPFRLPLDTPDPECVRLWPSQRNSSDAVIKEECKFFQWEFWRFQHFCEPERKFYTTWTQPNELALVDLGRAHRDHACMWYNMPASFDRELAKNKHYSKPLSELFGPGHSRLYRSKQLLSVLLQRPSPQYHEAAQKFLADLKWDAKYTRPRICVQLRVFHKSIDRPSAAWNRRIMADLPRVYKCIDGLVTDAVQRCVKQQQEQSSFTCDRPLVFVTSDDVHVRKEAARRFQSLKITANATSATPQALFSDTATVHTKNAPNISSALLEWYLLGECDTLIVTGSTFGFAAFTRNSTILELERHKRLQAAGYQTWGLGAVCGSGFAMSTW